MNHTVCLSLAELLQAKLVAPSEEIVCSHDFDMVFTLEVVKDVEHVLSAEDLSHRHMLVRKVLGECVEDLLCGVQHEIVGHSFFLFFLLGVGVGRVGTVSWLRFGLCVFRLLLILIFTVTIALVRLIIPHRSSLLFLHLLLFLLFLITRPHNKGLGLFLLSFFECPVIKGGRCLDTFLLLVELLLDCSLFDPVARIILILGYVLLVVRLILLCLTVSNRG